MKKAIISTTLLLMQLSINLHSMPIAGETSATHTPISGKILKGKIDALEEEIKQLRISTGFDNLQKQLRDAYNKVRDTIEQNTQLKKDLENLNSQINKKDRELYQKYIENNPEMINLRKQVDEKRKEAAPKAASKIKELESSTRKIWEKQLAPKQQELWKLRKQYWQTPEGKK